MEQQYTNQQLLQVSYGITIFCFVLAAVFFIGAKTSESELGSGFWFATIAFFLSTIVISSMQKKIRTAKIDDLSFSSLKSQGYNKDHFIILQKYLGGIPEFERTGITYKLYPTKFGFEAFNSRYEYLGKIDNVQIVDILIEDKKEIQKRLSVTNIALFGLLGLAMRKSKELDISLLIIKIYDGRFSHEGVFSFEYTKEDKLYNKNANSYNDALTARNKIISHLKKL